VQCACCGQPGHLAPACPTVCTQCKEKSCPGNAGGVCVVCVDVDIPAVVTDATLMKRPLRDWVRDKLVLAQAKWRAAQNAGAAVKEASNVEALSGSSRINFWNGSDWRGQSEAHALEAQPPPFLLKQGPSAQVSAAEKSVMSAQWWESHMAQAMPVSA